MSENYKTLAEAMEAWLGGAGAILVGSFAGRAMWHAVEARKGRRKLFGIEILYELPIAIGMAVIGDGLAGWLGLQQTATLALVAALSYLGPRGSEVMLSKWYGKKIVGE